MTPEKDSTRRVAILVLGAHRSGTSCIAGILDSLGCQGPKTLMKENKWNEKGYFESQLIMRLNDEVLSAAGSRWDDWRPLPADWLASPKLRAFYDRATVELAAEFGKSSLIYLKDPRICRLLPFWRPVLESAGYDISCVHIHRNPEDAAASLNRREGMDDSIAMLIWLRHVLDAEFHSRSLPRVFISYADILENWTLLSPKMESALGFSFPALLPDDQSLIDRGLRHHNTQVEHLLNSEFASDLVKDSLRVLEQWAATEERENDYAELDAIRLQFDTCAPLFSEPLHALEREALKCSARLADAIRTGAELSAKFAEAEAQRANLQKQIENAAAEIAVLKNEATMFQVELSRTVDKVRQTYTSSTSWRVSAPVRALGALLKRRR